MHFKTCKVGPQHFLAEVHLGFLAVLAVRSLGHLPTTFLHLGKILPVPHQTHRIVHGTL